ncbi:hypothetical protein ACX80E_12695 [Arthrobacter sp. TMN-49]
MTNDANTERPDVAVTPERFSMRYGAPAVLIGWAVTFLVFCLGLTVFGFLGEGGFAGLSLLLVVLFYGFPVAASVGLPLAILIAWPLRRVRDQRLHVLAFALATGTVTAVLMFWGQGELIPGNFVIVAGVAVSAAIGRASVMKLVTWRNAL